MRNAIYITLACGIAFILFTFSYNPSSEYETSAFGNDHVSSVIAPSAKLPPRQSKSRSTPPFTLNDYTISPLADFTISARVLSRENYWMGRESDLSPVDFALGWGRMSDPAVLDNINIRQSNRWYYWKTPRYPIPRNEIETSSANMHMIPANEFIKDKLADIDEGDMVMIKGQLVRVEARDGWQWISSLSRNDTGDGACELVYVTYIDKL